MNNVVLMGRLTRDPEVRYSQGEQPMAIARYTLAVNRRGAKRGEENSADFINCVAFGKAGEFAEKYFKKGMQVCISGRIQTGSYTNKDGQKVHTTEVVAENQEFAEGRNNGGASAPAATPAQPQAQQEGPTEPPIGFMQIPDDVDEELPFS